MNDQKMSFTARYDGHEHDRNYGKLPSKVLLLLSFVPRVMVLQHDN
jgi:hypothetical protein